MATHEDGIDEFNEDGSLDEVDELITWLVQKIDVATSAEGFCGVDISGVRANVAMLALIIGNCAGGNMISRAKVESWARRIDEPFTNEEMWGFNPWRPALKAEWRVGCRATVQKLLDVLEDDDG